jgi:hypothetical protein
MSHTRIILKEYTATSIPSLRAATRVFGGELTEATHFRTWAGALKECQWKITHPTSDMDIGITVQPDGKLNFEFDDYHGNLKAAFGEEFEDLWQEETAQRLVSAIEEHGKMYEREEVKDAVVLKVYL